jgi:ketosteroid isomerase-like protein
MSDEKIASIMHDFIQALEKKDSEKALSLCADDAVWVTPEGSFKGKGELKRYLTWLFDVFQNLKVAESGNKIIVQGDRAFYEHIISATYQGVRAECLAICAWEFSGEKIQQMRTVQDRLSIAKQAAKGPLAKWLVNSIVKRAEKGLH